MPSLTASIFGENTVPEQPQSVTDKRFLQVQRWFAQQKKQVAKHLGLDELPEGEFFSASSDASFRRYFRWQCPACSLIIMDAPPEQENIVSFIHIAQLLQDAGLHAPRVLAQDLQQGFLLLTDLGRQTWLEFWLEEPGRTGQAEKLFSQALEVLLRMQQIDSVAADLPRYDEALLRRELDLFAQWYVAKELDWEFNGQQQIWWDSVCQKLIDSALAQSRVFVHRDFMPRNLMYGKPNPGLIDFQDAVTGPISYDVVSLFKDAFISWDEELVERCLQRYWMSAKQAGLAVPDDFARFRRDCDWMGLQRHLKVIGIFARICHRDGKPRYLADVPRFFSYIDNVLERYPELAELRLLLDSLPGAGAHQ